MKNNILYLSGGPEAKKTFLHSDLLDIDLEGVGDTPWRSAWEKSFGEQQLFNQMVFFFQRIENKWYFVTKIVLTYCEKKKFLVIEKNF